MPIAHAEEVEQVFDAISYCKGACVVKMLNAVLGMDMFKKGLQVTHTGADWTSLKMMNRRSLSRKIHVRQTGADV